VLSYSYEYGYYSRLNIPFDFIEVNLSILARINVFLFLIFLFFIGSADIIYAFKIHKMAKGRKILFYFYLLFVLAILPMVAFDYLRRWLPWIIVSTLLYLIAEFIFPLFANKKIKGSKNKLEQEIRDDTKEYEGDFLDVVIKRIGYSIYLLIVFLLSSTYIAFSVGAIKAKNQKDFLVMKSNPELVIIRKYSQNVICAEYDKEKKELKNKFYFKTMDQISTAGIQLCIEEIGPLIGLKKENNKKKK
jgi:Ca2+/Na+ antiporter